MQSIRVSDSYDNDIDSISSVSNSMNRSLNPKFITILDEIDDKIFPSFQKIKKNDSLKTQRTLKQNHMDLIQTKKVNYFMISKGQSTQKNSTNLQLVKKMTVFQDKIVNLFQLFKKAQDLASNNNKNKKAIRFVGSYQKNSKQLLVQKTQWMFFKNYQGPGIMLLPDNRRIKGYWRNSIAVGKVFIKYPNQSLYYGHVNSHLQKHGQGCIYFKMGDKLEGVFMNGKMIGSGIYFNQNGKVLKEYKFKNGLLLSSKGHS